MTDDEVDEMLAARNPDNPEFLEALAARKRLRDLGPMNRKTAAKLALKFTYLHNLACLEYKAEFKRVGAKMWHFDDAHAYKLKNLIHITGSFGTIRLETVDKIWSMTMPLTVLDSYPNVSAKDKKKLTKACLAIRQKYQAEWEEFLKEVE